MSDDEILAAGLAVARRSLLASERIARTCDEQPALLAAARNAAAAARETSVEAEPWADALSVIPTQDAAGELCGMAAFPGIEAKEIWGSRLLFDLIGCTNNDSEINDVLSRYFTLLNGDTDHLFIIMSAALVTAADTVIPMLLKDIEEHGNNYDARVYLADAARKSWELSVARLKDADND